MSYQRVFASLVSECADAGKKVAQQFAMCGDVRSMRLYFQESVGSRSGELVLVPVGEEPPAGFKPGASEELNGGVPYDRYFQWVYDRSLSLPVLGHCN